MFLPIREGIAEVLHELKQLWQDTEHTEGWAESFGIQLERALGREVKLAQAQSVKSVSNEGCHKAPQIIVSSTPDLRKRPRELTVSPTVAEVARGAAKRGTLRGPAQGNRSDTFAPLKKISLGTTISRGKYIRIVFYWFIFENCYLLKIQKKKDIHDLTRFGWNN